MLDTLHVPLEDFVDGVDEAVCGPPCELMEQDERVWVQFRSAESTWLHEGEGGTAKHPQGNAVECVARKPDAQEALDEGCSDGNMSRISGVEFGLRLKEICGDA